MASFCLHNLNFKTTIWMILNAEETLIETVFWDREMAELSVNGTRSLSLALPLS